MAEFAKKGDKLRIDDAAMRKDEKKVGAFKKMKEKMKIIACSAMLSIGVAACEGYTDLSEYRVTDDPAHVQVDTGASPDAGYNDAGHKDAGHLDGGAVDSGQLTDAGSECLPNTATKILLELLIGSEKVLVNAGEKVKIGDEEYMVNVSENTGDLILTDKENKTTIVQKGTNARVNGKMVSLEDMAVGKAYYESRALLNVVFNGALYTEIVGENNVLNFENGNCKTKLIVNSIESWDNKGNVLTAAFEVTGPDFTLTQENVEIGNGGYAISKGNCDLTLKPTEFGIDLYPARDAPSNLCATTYVNINVKVDNTGKNYKEGGIVKVSDNIKIELVKAFIGSDESTTFVEIIVKNGSNEERMLVRPGRQLFLKDGSYISTVTFGRVDFKTVPAEGKDGGTGQ